ncbi:MAG: hypothetical protein ACJ77M_13450, partial [Thermoleophilaceae bacterium]
MKLLPAPLRRRRNGNGTGTETPARTREDDLAIQREKEADAKRRREALLEIPIQTVGWLDERTGGGPFLRGFLYRKVPRGTNWYYTLGSATMFAFV